MSKNERRRMMIVPFDGPEDAKLYVVGEAPGKNEETEGRPFVGASGKLLMRVLLDRGVRREEVRLANVMKVRPGGDDFSRFSEEEVIEGTVELIRDIERCRPNVILALGNQPLFALTGEWGITRWRGSVIWSKLAQCKVIPAIHPSAIMRQWDYFPLFLFDVTKAVRESEQKEVGREERKLEIAPTFKQVISQIERLKKSEKVAFDLETMPIKEMHKNIITCVGLSDSKNWAICIPFTKFDTTPYWSGEEEIKIMKAIKGLMEGDNKKVAQNAQFDVGIFKAFYGINVNNLWMDTMCAHHTVYPELPKGLDVMCSLYTNQLYYKHWRNIGSDVMFWKYNALDACVTFEVAETLDKEMDEFKVNKFYYKHVHPLIDILLDVQLRGVRIDKKLMEEARTETSKEIERVEAELAEKVGRVVNVNSPKQLKELLYKDMKLPPKIKRKTGKETVDEEALLSLSSKYHSPLFDLILKARHLHKILHTYLETSLVNGRMHTSYNIGGRVKDSEKNIESAPETGRLSSSESIIYISGTNLQNIPKGVCRKIFIPDERKIFIGADLSQAEARIVAYLANEEKLIGWFKEGKDIHKLNASWIYEKEVKDVTEKERYFAKRHVHAFNYGEGPRQFASFAGVSMSEARMLIGKYFDVFPNIRMWQFRVQKQLERSKILTTPFGRKRQFFGRWGDTLFREAYAYIPQSTVADLLNLSLIRMNTYLRESGVKAELMLQIHDAAVWQLLDDEEEKIKFRKGLDEAFDIKIKIDSRECVIPIEVKEGNNWDEV